jgi:hypothetical protein
MRHYRLPRLARYLRVMYGNLSELTTLIPSDPITPAPLYHDRWLYEQGWPLREASQSSQANGSTWNKQAECNEIVNLIATRVHPIR